mmetsp:Transcript_1119/g.7203  ORF Transcript_1119/g.7203 Transcript_1119/m.7203 type:complete len:324 (+) Transcript_1119:402-1373(+)
MSEWTNEDKRERKQGQETVVPSKDVQVEAIPEKRLEEELEPKDSTREDRENRGEERTQDESEESQEKEGAWLGTVSFADISMEEEPEEEKEPEQEPTPKLAVRLGAARKASGTSSPPTKEFAAPARVMQAQPPKPTAHKLELSSKDSMTAPPVQNSHGRESAEAGKPVVRPDEPAKKVASLPKLPPRPAPKAAGKGEEAQSKGKKTSGSKPSAQPGGDRKGSARGSTVPAKAGTKKHTKRKESHKARNGLILGAGAAALSLAGGVAAFLFSGRGRDSGVKKMSVRKIVLVDGKDEMNSKGKRGKKKKKTLDQALEDSGLLSHT